jgi:hypothetical protein
MATLSEHAEKISAAIEAARKDGYRLSLEDRDSYEEAYVDLEEYVVSEDGRDELMDWQTIIPSFD